MQRLAPSRSSRAGVYRQSAGRVDRRPAAVRRTRPVALFTARRSSTRPFTPALLAARAHHHRCHWPRRVAYRVPRVSFYTPIGHRVPTLDIVSGYLRSPWNIGLLPTPWPIQLSVGAPTKPLAIGEAVLV